MQINKIFPYICIVPQFKDHDHEKRFLICVLTFLTRTITSLTSNGTMWQNEKFGLVYSKTSCNIAK